MCADSYLSNPLEGVRAVATGGTSGLGFAMAKALVDAGAQVAITGRDQLRAATTSEDIGPGATGFELDVRDEHSVATFADKVQARLGGVDLLINNAGIGMKTVNPKFLEQMQPFWEVAKRLP